MAGGREGETFSINKKKLSNAGKKTEPHNAIVMTNGS